MYEPFYKLHPTPFRLTPDPHFFFESETHKRGLAYLRFAFYQREGFVVITGSPGTGKTELMLNLIEELPRQKVTFAKIVSTNLDADDLLDLVAASFLTDTDHVSKGSLLKKLENYFISQARTGKQVLLIIDEAHNLSVKSLLELSMLANFQINEKPVLQCFLLGQLPLEEKINLPDLEPLKQRVIASARLESLDQQETREYIVHRLSKSGWENNPVIQDNAFSYIHLYTKGVPRKINSLCNRLLLHSYMEDQHKIVADMVHQVIQEIQEEAVAESLDLDFADMQTIIESSVDSQQEDGEQAVLPEKKVLPKENKKQTPVKSNSKKRQASYKSPVDEINIPEFIKKKQDNNSGRQVKLLKENRVPDTPELPLEDAALKTDKRFQSMREPGFVQKGAAIAVNVRKKLDVQQCSSRSSSSKDNNVAKIKHVTRQPVNRPSGLLDKELRFLSSLTEPTIPAVQEPKQKKATHSGAMAKVEPETEITPKVIIDESVNDYDVGDDVLVESNVAKDWREPADTNSTMAGWRLAALGAVVVGIIIVSIGWLAEDNSVSSSIVAENDSGSNSHSENSSDQEVFLNAAPVDIELPVLTAPVIDVTTSNEAGNETDDPGSSTAIASVAQSASIVEITSTTESADSSNNSKTSGLDAQMTQILEKTGAEHVGPSGVEENAINASTEKKAAKSNARESGTKESNTQTTLASVSTDKRRVRPKQGETIAHKSSANSQSRDKPADKSHAASVDSSAVSISTVNGSKSVAMQKSKPEAAMTGLLLNNPANRVSLGVTTGGQRPDQTGASISLLNTGLDNVSPQEEPAISPADLTTLLFRLASAYENGNLQQLVTTFAPDIKSSDGSNRLQMLKEYQRLFTITDKRELTIRDVEWSAKDRQMFGEGDFEVLIREKGATKYTTYQGKISFAVARESDMVVIKKLDYDYGQ
jgi:type II secretory pathway predicted ATPase ExeA